MLHCPEPTTCPVCRLWTLCSRHSTLARTGEARALGAGSHNRPEKARPAQSWVLLTHFARLVATCQGTGLAWTLPEALSL